MVLRPVIDYIIGALPDDVRKTNPTELHFGDLDKMTGDAVICILTWLLDKVDCFSTADIRVREKVGLCLLSL